jgi:hypothetical protein
MTRRNSSPSDRTEETGRRMRPNLSLKRDRSPAALRAALRRAGYLRSLSRTQPAVGNCNDSAVRCRHSAP